MSEHTTTNIDKLYLELSQISKATTSKEIALQAEIAQLKKDKADLIEALESDAYAISFQSISQYRNALLALAKGKK